MKEFIQMKKLWLVLIFFIFSQYDSFSKVMFQGWKLFPDQHFKYKLKGKLILKTFYWWEGDK